MNNFFLQNLPDKRFFYINNEVYNFIDHRSDIQSIIHAINLLGEDLVGVEVGIAMAQSFCTLLQNCLNIKTLHGIDPWVPFTDYIKEPYDNLPARVATKKEIEFVELTALHNIKYSGHSNKAVIHKLESKEACKLFSDCFFDFVFLDSYLTYEQCASEIKQWYSKVKVGGLFSGHDWHSSAVKNAVNEFRKNNNITSRISVFDKTWCWIKK